MAEPTPPHINSQHEAINDELMRARIYPALFSASECTRILSLPGDPELTALYRNQAEALLPDGQRLCPQNLQLLPYTPEAPWLFERLGQLLYSVNADFYHFEIENLGGTQIVRLNPGEQIDWHLDLGDGDFARRKLSLLLFLSESESYSGGFLEFGSSAQRPFQQQQGTVLIFPSFFMTRIHPVQTGQMVFLQSWLYGPQPFR